MMDPRTDLSVPVSVCHDVVSKMGFGVEAPSKSELAAWQDRREDFTSAHAPFCMPRVPGDAGTCRVNIAATDTEFRAESLAVIERYIRGTKALPHCRIVNMHAAPKVFRIPAQMRGAVGAYELLIEGLRRLADVAGSLGRVLVVENNRCYWDEIPPDDQESAPGPRVGKDYFGTTPEEWLAIGNDVAHDNFGLCLDTSHAATFVQTVYDRSEREKLLMAFLERPWAIRHVHWNGNYIEDFRGRDDQHLALGADSLPRDFHRAVKALPLRKLLEHDYGQRALDAEMEFIAGL